MTGTVHRHPLSLPLTLLLAAAASTLSLTTATAPIALNFVVIASSNSEKLIRLRAYDSDGDTTTTSVTSFHGCDSQNCGSHHQLSQPYSAYGYEPKIGSAITDASTTITGSGNRLVYTPPKNKKAPEDRWGWLEWQANDGSSSSTKPGIVALLAPGNLLVQSSFTFGTDGWFVTSNGAGGVSTSHSPSSRGLLNHYIYSRDDEINVDPSTGKDTRLWYFVAPSKFLASALTNPTNMLAFGGSLTFTISSQAGDFSPGNMNTNVPFVVMECATCNSGMGIRLLRMFGEAAAGGLPFDGTERQMTVPLTTSTTNAANGVLWLKDSKSTLIPNTETNDCELIEVLNGLSKLSILGDFTKWHESVSIDDVQLVAGHPVTIPLSCYPVGP